MALPRYLYSITKTSREPLVARRKDGGRQAELEEELELEQSTSSNIPCNKREVFANDTQRPPSGESTEIYSAASHAGLHCNHHIFRRYYWLGCKLRRTTPLLILVIILVSLELGSKRAPNGSTIIIMLCLK